MTFEEHIPLAPHTTFRIGGEARYFCAVTSRKELLEAFVFANSRRLETLVLGGGSNILVRDVGFSGLVIQINLRGIREEVLGDFVRLEVGAGESWDDLVALCVLRGYWGMENLSLIPGTVGAAPVQNIGAYGTEAKDVIESVSVVWPATGESRVLSNVECGFGYRDSMFKRAEGKGLVIVGVTFMLSKKPRPNLGYKDIAEYFTAQGGAMPTLSDIREAVISIRKSKFPDLSQFGTAGSFWKNPVISLAAFDALKAIYPLMPSYPAGFGGVKIPLAWVLDLVCGFKGHAKGPVHLFRNQPLVLTVEKGATAAQVDAFAREIEATVKSKTGIIIEREVNSLLC